MTPDDLSAVQGSWSELRRLREPLLDVLARRFAPLTASPAGAAQRAGWLFAAVDELVGLLPSPSHLAVRARSLGESWPDRLTAPSFAVEGRAWMEAAAACWARWSDDTEAAWRQAWLLLSDVLAAEALSPFTDGPTS